MKILHVSMKYDYGDPRRGLSYEYINFYKALQVVGYDIEFFDYMSTMQQHGKKEMNKALLKKINLFQPDVAIFSLYTDQIDVETVLQARSYTHTFCFFHDDTWRIEFTRRWARHFDVFSSPDYACKNIYPEIGLNNFYYFPFGVNENIYKPRSMPDKVYDITFVGGYNPYRAWLVKKIQKTGFKVEVFGFGWPNGVLEHDDMVRVFCESKINLNLSNSTSWDLRYLLSSPRGLLHLMRSSKTGEQMKARIFEINACNAFQLSYYVEGLEHCYEIGEEIGVYLSPDDLLKKLRFYLDRPALRERIAQRALQRTLLEHTYGKRFEELFQFIKQI